MYTLLLCLWPMLHLLYSKYESILISSKDKIIRNKLAFSNAIGTLFLGITYYYTESETIFNLAILYPMSYYIYDTYLIINNKYYNEMPYFYHHMVTIYLLENIFLTNLNFRYILLNILISAELSNLPIYAVYHLIKTGDNNKPEFYNKLINWKIFQISWYVIIRVIYFSYIIYYKYYNIEGFILRNLIITVYLLGLYWVFGQIRSLKNDKVKKNLLKKE